MAATLSTAQFSGALASVFDRVATRWRRSLDGRRRADQVWRELNLCSDRDLADLGLSRADIPRLARAARDQA